MIDSIKISKQLICEPKTVPRVSSVGKIEEKIPDQLRAREIPWRLERLSLTRMAGPERLQLLFISFILLRKY
jgi:hypothetical protein